MISEQELLAAHRGWLGNLVEEQVGLVVTAPALVRAQASIDKSTLPELQLRFLAHLPALAGKTTREINRVRKGKGQGEETVTLEDPLGLVTDLFGWPLSRLAGAPSGPPLPDLAVRLDDFPEDRLEPTWVLLGSDASEPPVLLVRVEETGTDLDRSLPEHRKRWTASPEARFERLLQERDIPLGVLINGESIRIVYAPSTEIAGHLTFPVALMTQTAGRDVLGGLVVLLRDTLLTGPTEQRLPAILRQSRRFQNEVSSELAEQVMGALGDLLGGFQAARVLSGEALLAHELANDPAHIYGGLLTTLMRLVFLLYAEDQGLLPADPIFIDSYSLTGLYERLRDDDVAFHDTMDQRYGAWAQILTLFSMVFFGARHRGLRLPARLGELFDPNAFAFLEGRPYEVKRGKDDRIEAPRVSDGAVFRVLHQLLFLQTRGVLERISYRTLDVEQIGSVYEAMMGYTLESADGPSLSVKPHHAVVSLTELLRKKPDERIKTLAEVDCKVSGAALAEVKKAASVEALAKALVKSISARRPGVLAAGTLYLQPTEERRKSGSHYTPRELTGPIVRKTLAPILARLGETVGGARAGAILGLKVCDPAMGSGAFLVEACRQLAAAVVDAWKREPEHKPKIPADETETMHAMRLVAQTCLYGVDKNPFAVALAKLSLWLVTLAKDHPFTFLDHALRDGDSLVGLGREQIASFSWVPSDKVPLLRKTIDDALKLAEGFRAEIYALADSDDTKRKQELLADADAALAEARAAGDLVVEVFFTEKKDKARKERLKTYSLGLKLPAKGVREAALKGLKPFHWEIEFPEVFSRENPGFDAFVGNPPFVGGKKISTNYGDAYTEWLAILHEETSSNADLVAHFFRRAFTKLRKGGTFGLIATNSIAQGDTRAAGLRWICQHDGVIYEATRRYKWPGLAAVIVSVVHVGKSPDRELGHRLDGKSVEHISAFLFHQGSDNDPIALEANANKSFQGSIVLGMGFTFDDTSQGATSIAEMQTIVQKNSKNAERIFPYVGGEDLNSHPEQKAGRYVINFGQMTEAEARTWPDLMAVLEAKVRLERLAKSKEIASYPWWQFWRNRPELEQATRGMNRVLVCSRHQPHWCLAYLPTGAIFSEGTIVFALASNGGFALLQSRIHEVWARFLGSSLEDRLRYTPTDCFQTFPFPPAWETSATLEAAGKTYSEFRAALMIQNQQGLTTTYNRFHDPEEADPEILRLRALHDAMDRAVLDAYGFTDLAPVCTFLLDYEEAEEDEAETAGKARKKKPWRYRWPEATRDEVLARLLQLNQERAAEEAGAKPAAAKGKK
jgi:hypothetical protein